MIKPCTTADSDEIVLIINEAAEAYRGVIPADCFHEPYMPKTALLAEIKAGVEFWGWYEDETLLGVMGIQKVKDVTLIRHAYVRRSQQGKGIGGALLNAFITKTTDKLLVGTWATASWAIRLYEKHGFRLVSAVEEKDELLNAYWNISPRQTETSVVLMYAK